MMLPKEWGTTVRQTQVGAMKRMLATAAVGSFAAAALAGCAGQSTGELSHILEESGDDIVGGGAAGGSGGVELAVDEESVPPSAELVEARVYCLPEGATHSVTINDELFEFECGGADRAEVIGLEAAALRETGRLEAEMNLDGSSGAAEWAIIVEAVQP